MRRSFLDITNSINKYFQDNFLASTIKFSGMHFDTNAYPHWVHITITEDTPPAQRKIDRPINNIVVVIMVFVKYSSKITKIQEIMEEVARIFHQKDVSLLSLGPGSCTVRFREAISVFHGY